MSGPTQTLEKTYADLWRTRGLNATVPRGSAPPDATIPVPPPSRAPETRGLPSLPRFALDAESERASELALGETLGEGGMGLVRKAVQVPLRREVAVKTLREGIDDERAAWELLRESWLTGRLEHPNIVPVYALGRDPAGQPMLVMKRIGGQTWREFLRDASLIPAGRERLSWHIGVLREVCQAIDFAHSRGILHRDIKPDNVMIGDFGEVTLLDWGVAVSLNEGDRGRVPLAREVDSIAGTPRYMAPEMAEARGEALGPHSDVYLLGAVLCEVLTGRPPHRGDKLFEVLQAAYASAPPALEGAPEEAAEICRKALARDPEERYASVGEFAAALERFVEHQGSARLAAEARSRLADLRELVSELSVEPGAEGWEDAEMAVARRYAEVRFGFQQALEAWPENPEARAGLQQAGELAAEQALRAGDARGAMKIIEELPAPVEELRGRCEAGIAEAQRKAAELERLRGAADLSVGAGMRATYATIFAILWAIIPVGIGVYARSMQAIPKLPFVLAAIVFAATLIPGRWVARRGSDNEANRRIFRGLLLGALFMFLNRLQAVILGVDFGTLPNVMVREMGVFAFTLLALSNAVDRRLLPAGMAYFPGLILGTLAPDWIFEVSGLSNGIACALAAWAWTPIRPECSEDSKDPCVAVERWWQAARSKASQRAS